MAKEFKVGNQILKVSDELEEYNKLHHRFVLSAEGAKKLFRTYYEEFNSSLDDVRNKVKSEAMESLHDVIVDNISMLLNQDIYDVDQYIFIDEYCDSKEYLPIFDACDVVINKCNQIDINLERKKVEREYNKETRGRVMGGGFGFAGAIKGMATAEAMNFATGVAYSGANMIGNWIDGRIANSEKRAIFHDPETLKNLEDALYKSAFNTHYAYIDIVEERTGTAIKKYEPSEERKALAMRNNIDMVYPDRELEEKIAVQMLATHPYDPYYYKTIISKYGDENGELQTIAEFFNVDIEQVKKELLMEYYATFSFATLVSIEDLIEKMKNRENYYGYSPDKSDVLNEVIFREYCMWKLERYYDKKTGLYFKEKSKAETYLQTKKAIRKKIKDEIQTIYQQYYGEEKNRFIHVGNELSEYMYCSISNNTQVKAHGLSLTTSAITYGEGMKIPYELIQDIKVENRVVIINQVYRIPLLQNINEEKLEAFLNAAVSHLQKQDLMEVANLFDLSLSKTEESSKKIDFVLKLLMDNKKETREIINVFSVLSENNLYQLENFNNIKVILDVFKIENKNIHPVMWIKTEKNNTLFEEKGIYFTWNGTFIPYEAIQNKFELVDGKIVYKYKNYEFLVAENCCSEMNLLTELLNYICDAFAGKETAWTPQTEHLYEDSYFMEDAYRTITSWILKRSGEDSRRLLGMCFSMNYNDSHFLAFAKYYKELYNLDIKEEIMLLVREAYYSNNVIMVGKNNIYVLKRQKEKQVEVVSLEDFAKLSIDFYNKKKPIYIEKTTGEKVYFSDLVEHEQVMDRAVVLELLLNEILKYLKKKMGIPCSDEKKTTMSQLLKEKYNHYFTLEKRAKKNMAFISEVESLSKMRKWTEEARGRYLSSSENEKIVCFFKFPGFTNTNCGLVISEKYIYIKANTVQKIMLDDIIEVRLAKEENKVEIQFATDKNIYGISVKEQNYAWFINDFVADIIFLMQKNKSAILDIYDLREMEIERKQERRKKPAEIEDRHKDVIQMISEYCEEHAETGLFEDEGPQIFVNDESDEFKTIYEEAVASTQEKPDPCEIPLLLLKPAEAAGKSKFGKKNNKIVIFTNEFVYNLKGKGITGTSTRKQLDRFEKMELTEESKLSKAKLYMTFLDEWETKCEVLVGTEEQNEIYLEFYQYLMNCIRQVTESEKFQEEELQVLRREVQDLCGNINQLEKEDINEIREKLLEYKWSCCEEEEKSLELKMKQIVHSDLLNGYREDMSLEELKQLKNDIEAMEIAGRYKKEILFKVEQDIILLSKKQVQEKADMLSRFAREADMISEKFGPLEEGKRTFIAESILTLPSGENAVKEMPLIVGVEDKKSMPNAYMLMENRILLFENKKFSSIRYEEIDKLIIVQRLGSMAITAVVNGKNNSVTTMHKKNTKEYAVLLWKMITYLKNGTVLNDSDIDIEQVSLKEQAKAMTDNVAKKMDGGMKKISSVTEGLTGEMKENPKEAAKKLTGNIGGVFGKATSMASEKAKAAGEGLSEKGSSLANLGTKDCPDCGNKVKITGKFCSKCGHRF